MRIAILTLGTRGDLQPYIALALGLKKAGHDVILSGPENFSNWVAEYNIEYQPGGIDIQSLLQSPEGREMVAGNPIAIMRNFREIGTRFMAEAIEASTKAITGADLLIYHPKVPVAVDLAEACKIPVIATALQPILVPTGDFPCMGVTSRSLGPRFNRWTYGALRAQRAMFSKQLNTWRQNALGLKPLSRFARAGVLNGQPIPVLHGISEIAVPRPGDWPAHAHMTGFWFLDDASGWTPSPELQVFLDAGPPPVYVGFGSMTDKDPVAKAALVVKALRRAKCRAVLAAGWGGLDTSTLPNTIFPIEGAPHDKLFPLMSAIAHHGGAGTTAAALRAGRPQIVLPYFADQPFWGERMKALGVAPPPLPQKKLTARKLARALRIVVSDKSMMAQAETIGRAMAQEDGVTKAVRLIEGYAT